MRMNTLTKAFLSLTTIISLSGALSDVAAAQYGSAYNPYGGTTYPATGYLPVPTQSDTRCPAIAQNLFRGLRDVYSGGDIYRLQTFLINEGLLSGDSATGFYGRATSYAVSQFQQSVGIYPGTGGFGPRTRAAVAARCGNVQPPVYPPNPTDCPAYPLAYPVCANNVQPEQVKDYRGCLTGYRCPTTGYYGTTPSISSFSGPSTLAVNQQGTWSVVASDPNNSQLTYTVTWGDEGLYGSYTLAAPSYLQNIVSQGTTYTHTYSAPGTYTVRISARNNAGYTATSTATVVVGNTYGTGNPDLLVVSPNTYATYQTGTTLPVTWFDSRTYFAAPRYDVYLRSYIPECTGYICPLSVQSSLVYRPEFQYTIATNQLGTNYSWAIPSNISAGNYVVEVCPTGSQYPAYTYGATSQYFVQTPCDRSDTYFTITNNGTTGLYPTATLFLNPSSGAAPLSTNATITLGLDPNSVSVCGTQTYGTLEWGDGTSSAVTYLGCSGSTVTIPLSHTYTSNGTYTARLVRNGQTTVQIPVTVGAGTSGGYISSVVVGQSSVARGGQITTNYTVASAPSNTSIGLELIDATTGISYGHTTLGQSPVSGSYTWTVPAYTSAVIADSPYVDGNKPLDGKSVYVKAKLYTPSNACFGYCLSTTQPTILAAANSGTFTISGTATSVNPTFTVSATGSRYVNVTTQTPVSGTVCGANGTLTLDYGDGTSVPISTTFSGSNICANESRSFTYQYSTTGSKTITIRNSSYPYQIYTTQTVNVI
jgi:hypothetical protein